MSDDIGRILSAWPYGDGSNVRMIMGDDGIEKIQVRVVIEGLHGLLQLNCEGRADGARPHGREFALDYYEGLARSAVKSGSGAFRLNPRQAAELFEESFVTYQRYIILMQMNKYYRVIRDTARNMKIFRFVHEHAGDPADRERLEKWWPYILRLHHTARVMLSLDEEHYGEALAIIVEARQALDALVPREDEAFEEEMARSRQALDELEQAVNERRPLSEAEQLERDKTEAIRAEDYERAARLRDEIESLHRHGRAKDDPQ